MMRDGRLGRRDFLCGVTGFAATAASASLNALPLRRFQARTGPSTPTWMYVGSFTGEGRGHGEGLSVFHRGRESNRWQRVQILKDLADPSFVIIDRAQRCLYSAHGDGTEVTAYTIDQATGRVSVLNRQSTGGTNGVHLAIDHSGRHLVVANYASGSVAVVGIDADGSLAPRTDLATLAGTPGPHRTQQESSHPHQCPFDPTGRVVVVPDKGLDKLFVFRVDVRGRLAPGTVPDVASRAGAGPRHVDFHPTRPYAYVINELDSTITSYRLDAQSGALQPLEVQTTLPSRYTGNNPGAEIVVSPSGRFVYASNRGHDSIAIFSIDDATGLLSSVGWQATEGKTPRCFALDPAGTHLYAANQNSDTVVVFRVNPTSGRLAATGETIEVASPVTMAFR